MLNRIVEEIERNRTFLITTHENPDGDAIGSSLALANFLKKLGKEVTVHLCDQVPDVYAFLPLAETIRHDIPYSCYDVCFVLDVGEFRRAGTLFNSFRDVGLYINVDHHLNCENTDALNYVDYEACATGALVYRIIKAAGHDIDLDIANCIYTAVITDTGSFRYSNANPEAFAIAGEMVGKGVNAWDLSEKLYESQPRERLELLSLALATLSISPRGDFASLSVSLDMYEKTGATAELTDGFVNYPRSIRGVEVAVFFREIKPGFFKVGFRSKGKVDVSALATAFGGGGHHNAAGCNVSGTLEEVKRQVFSHLEKAL
ncbi:bifunctional oligoribonuclease/PAP phosphatase NrnA [Geobacter sp. DSM 9736]|uniref:DHH family phosphoesterase n=1 Tax=Geobacter sp. DSM 9736 TaxID=1277350 RepID=UPI000B5045D9|nr:bifunctional oligoribonuclease/PAP phosphatase NrnA [Geobacter sp. DSM 9736]